MPAAHQSGSFNAGDSRFLMLAPGMRRTAQRTQVYNAIVGLGGHCTADEITAELHRTKPGFPRSTVYRALDALTASGSVYAAHLGEGATYYELASGDHHHAVCQVCGGGLHLQEGHHFKPLRTEVLVVGICDSCSRNPSPRAARRRTIDPHFHFT